MLKVDIYVKQSHQDVEVVIFSYLSIVLYQTKLFVEKCIYSYSRWLTMKALIRNRKCNCNSCNIERIKKNKAKITENNNYLGIKL